MSEDTPIVTGGRLVEVRTPGSLQRYLVAVDDDEGAKKALLNHPGLLPNATITVAPAPISAGALYDMRPGQIREWMGNPSLKD